MSGEDERTLEVLEQEHQGLRFGLVPVLIFPGNDRDDTYRALVDRDIDLLADRRGSGDAVDSVLVGIRLILERILVLIPRLL